MLCPPGRDLYARALREGRLPADAAPAACLLAAGLLYADPADPASLRPTAPAVALPRLLADIERRVALHRGRAARLASAFEPLTRAESVPGPGTTTTDVTVLKGGPRIAAAVRLAVTDARREILSIQPRGPRPWPPPYDEPWRMAEFGARGGRLRTLTRPPRDGAPPAGPAGAGGAGGETRALDALPPGLFVCDRAVAFIPAGEGGHLVFEVRSPALVSYVATAFDILWRLARPLYREAAPRLSSEAVPPVQREITRLLADGLTDREIAGRMHMNVRTVRVHIAKVAHTLGSTSRTQLGFLISRSGILEGRTER
ncbi:LuxR C-terminal-related transcriptional regulator [Streptomyces longispororuber]|uniref:helix-turn-helix transcriptional regulator n=1 Tax=Streptomyces longispororuber TaxID=68230 RepID=UPI0036F6E8A0